MNAHGARHSSPPSHPHPYPKRTALRVADARRDAEGDEDVQALHQHRAVPRALRHRVLLVVRARPDAHRHDRGVAQGRAGRLGGLRPGEELLQVVDVRGPVGVHHERVRPAGVEHALSCRGYGVCVVGVRLHMHIHITDKPPNPHQAQRLTSRSAPPLPRFRPSRRRRTRSEPHCWL